MNAHPYAFLLLFLAVALAFPLGMLALARLWFRYFQPPRSGQSKHDTYECGVAPSGDARIQFKAHYYLYALVFLIFDVEVVFLLPIAVSFGGISAAGALTALAFVFLLAEGLVWVWARRHLEWN